MTANFKNKQNARILTWPNVLVMCYSFHSFIHPVLCQWPKANCHSIFFKTKFTRWKQQKKTTLCTLLYKKFRIVITVLQFLVYLWFNAIFQLEYLNITHIRWIWNRDGNLRMSGRWWWWLHAIWPNTKHNKHQMDGTNYFKCFFKFLSFHIPEIDDRICSTTNNVARTGAECNTCATLLYK